MIYKRIIPNIVLGSLLLLITSCQNYQRNYTGPLRDRADVAFLFNHDSTIHGQLTIDDKSNIENLAFTTSIPDEYTSLNRIFGAEPNCRELIPGDYFIKVYKTSYETYPEDDYQMRRQEERVQKYESVIYENLQTWEFGPYRLDLNAKPGRIYLIDCIYSKQKWYERTEDPWEIKIKDVSDSPEFQQSLQKIKRK